MLSSKSFRPLVIAIATALTLMLGGCIALGGDEDTRFHPIGSITIADPPQTRNAQIFQTRLARFIRLYPNGEQHYRLTTDLTSTSDETSTTMSLTYALYDVRLGKNVAQGDISAMASFGGVSSLYSLEAAKQFADQRLARQLAERLYHRLLAFFGRDNGIN